MANNKTINEKVLYRAILRDAWHTVWSRKDLWFWGIFAALLGSAGEYHFMLSTFGQVANQQPFTPAMISVFQAPPLTANSWLAMWSALTVNITATMTLLIIVLGIIAVAAFLLWLTIASVIALVQAGALRASGRVVPAMSEGMRAAHKHFGPVLILLAFGRMLSLLLVAILVLFGALASIDLLMGGPIFVVAILLIVPALFAVSFGVRFAICSVVVENRTLLGAVESAKKLVSQHWLVSLELALLLSLVNIAVGLVLVALTVLLVMPFIVAAAVFAQIGSGIWSVWCLLLAIILFLTMLFALGGALGVFYWVAWSDLFVKLQAPGFESKIARIMRKMVRGRLLLPRRA